MSRARLLRPLEFGGGGEGMIFFLFEREVEVPSGVRLCDALLRCCWLSAECSGTTRRRDWRALHVVSSPVERLGEVGAEYAVVSS